MDEKPGKRVGRRHDAFGRILRRGRILARRREGWAYDEIAREEGLTAERIRQIVREVFRKRPVENGADHAKLQLARLTPALQAAEAAILDGRHEGDCAFPEGAGPGRPLAGGRQRLRGGGRRRPARG